MVQLRRMISETDPLSFFPVPYPDESFYSILCRYMVHSGLPSTRETLMVLFGKEFSPGSTLLLPYMSSIISKKINPETGITEDGIIRGHTAFHYFRIAHRPKESEAMFERIRNGRNFGYRFNYKKSMAATRLCYCPVCAFEEKNRYGEMYWHREHQIGGIVYCKDHAVKLKESLVRLGDIKRSFIPASFALRDIYGLSLDEACGDNEYCRGNFKEKYKAIQRDIKWLMETGDKLPGLEETIRIYEHMFEKSDMIDYSSSGMIEDLPGLRRMVKEYFGGEFLSSLHLELHEYFEWDSAPSIIMKYLTPLQHVLLMEFLCGSAEEFYRQGIKRYKDYLPCNAI